MQRSIRFPDDLDARIAKLAADEDRAFSWVVLRTLEKALATNAGSVEDARVSPADVPAPSQPPEHPHAREMKRQLDAPVPHGPTSRTPSPLAARQAALNKSKGM